MRRRRRDEGGPSSPVADGGRETADGARHRELIGRPAPLPAGDDSEESDVTHAEDGTEGFVPL